MKISIVTIIYKPGAIFAKFLENIAKFTYSVELVIIDNYGLDDGFYKQILELNKIHKIIYIFPGENVGFAKACNIGADYSHCDEMLFVNPDIHINAELVSSLLEERKKHDYNFIISPRLMHENGEEQAGSRRNNFTMKLVLIEGLKLFKLRFLKLKRYLLHESEVKDELIECGSGAIFAINRKQYMKTNGFDERFFLHFEDSDFFLSQKINGAKILFKADIEAIHKRSSANVSFFKIFYYKSVSMIKFLLKHNHQFPMNIIVILFCLVIIPLLFIKSALRELRKIIT